MSRQGPSLSKIRRQEMQRKKHQIRGYDHSIEDQLKIDRDLAEDKAMVALLIVAFIASIPMALSLIGFLP